MLALEKSEMGQSPQVVAVAKTRADVRFVSL